MKAFDRSGNVVLACESGEILDRPIGHNECRKRAAEVYEFYECSIMTDEFSKFGGVEFRFIRLGIR